MFYITFGFSTPDRWNHTQGIKFLQMLVRGYMREDERLNSITIDYMENDDTEPIGITGKEKLEKLSRIRSSDDDVQDMYLQIIEFFDTTGLPGSRK